MHANHLANLLPTGSLQERLQAEVFTGEKPSMNRLKVRGCIGHVLLNKRRAEEGEESSVQGQRPACTRVPTLKARVPSFGSQQEEECAQL